jgi:flagellar biosynthesis/type III secretory pathway protein FliH
MRLLLTFAGEAPLLLADGWRVPASQVAAFDDARQTCRTLAELAAARQAEAERARCEGFEAGMREGREAAAAEAAAAVSGAMLAWRAAVDELQARCGGLALEVVRRLAGELDADDLLRGVARCVLEEIRQEQPFAVRTSPARAAKAEEWARCASPPLRLLVDEALPDDVCEFETAFGSVRAGFRLGLAALEQALAAADAPRPAQEMRNG